MSGQIFISYRRQETWGVAGRLFDRLGAQFGQNQIFMDLDSIELGENFMEAIETTVSKCDVLLAVIGNNWLTAKDEYGDRRLDNAADWVRKEIGTALHRQIRVIPILVDSARMPRLTDLPEDLQPLVSLNALRITGDTFRGDLERLVDAIKPILEKAAAKEQERLATEQCQREEAEARQRAEKERLETRAVDEVGSELNRVSADRKMPEGKLRLTVHRAYFVATGTECFFVNATNISLQWDLEITHVWFATNPEVHVINPDRPLPRRLKPQESWETWVRTTAIPRATLEQIYTLARARLSTGEIIESIENIGVPKSGTVSGGDYRPI